MFEIAWFNPQEHSQLGLPPGRYQISGCGTGRGDAAWASQAPAAGSLELNDPWMVGRQASLDLWENGQVRIQNTGRPILFPSGQRINRGQVKVVNAPVDMVIGSTRLAITAPPATRVDDTTLCTLNRDLTTSVGDGSVRGGHAAPALSTLTQWFDSLNALQLSTAGSQAFLDQAVQCTFDPGGLDLGMLLHRDGDDWQIVSSHVPFPEFGFSFRRDLVERVAASGDLWYHAGYTWPPEPACENAQWIVAAPITDAEGQVTTVLYAARFESPFNKRHGIRPIEAYYLRLVADAVSAAKRRLQAEAAATRAQVLLERTFSPPVVNLLQRDPQLLDSRQSEVSVLFADLRGFTALSECLGAGLTHQLLGDLLELWTQAVQARQGVVIDYYGDGLAAFWNCPLTTADHPWLACQTAWQMMSDLETINRAWSSRLPAPLMAGVGINTGVAQVGNSGTQGKLKYGPRGQVVNLASRLEQATKHFGASILLSAATAGHVKDRCRLLRLCRSRLPGFAEPDQIYQLLESAPTDEQIRAAQSYAAALEAYESGQLPECVEIIAAFHQRAIDDQRFDYLLDQVEKSCQQTGRSFPSATLERRRISIPKSDRAIRPYQASGHESER